MVNNLFLLSRTTVASLDEPRTTDSQYLDPVSRIPSSEVTVNHILINTQT